MKKLFVLLVVGMLGSSLFAQTDLTGTWNTGEKNTIVKIYEKEGLYVGEIISSDKPDAKIGNLIIKDVKKDDDEWKGKLYAAKKKKWVNARLSPEDDMLKIKVKMGFISKTVEWKKAKSESETDEIKAEDKETDKETDKEE